MTRIEYIKKKQEEYCEDGCKVKMITYTTKKHVFLNEGNLSSEPIGLWTKEHTKIIDLIIPIPPNSEGWGRIILSEDNKISYIIIQNSDKQDGKEEVHV